MEKVKFALKSVNGNVDAAVNDILDHDLLSLDNDVADDGFNAVLNEILDQDALRVAMQGDAERVRVVDENKEDLNLDLDPAADVDDVVAAAVDDEQKEEVVEMILYVNVVIRMIGIGCFVQIVVGLEYKPCPTI